MVEHLLGDFDAATDETDRRIFFEVTGRQLIKGEFQENEDSSDEEWRLVAQDPQQHAFNFLHH